MNLSLTIKRDNIFKQRPSCAVMSLILLSMSASLYGACVAPPNLRTQLQSKATAQAHADIGQWFAERKQFACASKSFELASELQPTSVTFAFLWGLSLSSAGHDAEALAPLHRASSLEPGDIRPHLSLAAALDRLKRTADAEEEWRKALAIDADSTIALDGLSQDLIDQHDFRAVVSLLDKAANNKQRSPLQSLNLGIAFAGTARLDNAVTVLREDLNTNPDSLPIADELAVVLVLLSRVEEAYAVFDLALQKHPDDQATQLLYLRTLVSSHSEKAPQYAQKLLAAYPSHWEVLYLNGLVASGEGDFQRTRDFVERSVALNANFPQSQRLLGSTLAKLGDLRGAQEHLEKAIQSGDRQPEVHYDLAKVFQGLGDKENAEQQLRTYQEVKTAQSDKTQAAGKAEVADQEMRSGNAVKAASLYREALESDPNEALLHYKLAKALEKNDDESGEKSALERAIQLNPDLPEAQNQMGYLAARDGNSELAEKHFRAALHASPSYVVAWVNLAATLASESKWQDAKQAIGHALEIDPDNAQARQLSEALATAAARP
jgi:tetratricopeptide (TPR) repeat protein